MSEASGTVGLLFKRLPRFYMDSGVIEGSSASSSWHECLAFSSCIMGSLVIYDNIPRHRFLSSIMHKKFRISLPLD